MGKFTSMWRCSPVCCCTGRLSKCFSPVSRPLPIKHSAALREDHSEAIAEEASRVTVRIVYKCTTPAVLSSLLLTQLTYVDADACVSESLNCTTPQGFPEILLAPVCTYSAHCSPNIFSPAVVKWLGFTTHQDACTLQRCDLRLFFTLAVDSVSLLSLNLI